LQISLERQSSQNTNSRSISYEPRFEPLGEPLYRRTALEAVMDRGPSGQVQALKPNILLIMGDDIGWFNGRGRHEEVSGPVAA
jgi:hypothetical protein